MKLHYHLRQQTDISILQNVALSHAIAATTLSLPGGKGGVTFCGVLCSRIFLKPRYAPQRAVLTSIIRMVQIPRNYRSVAETMTE